MKFIITLIKVAIVSFLATSIFYLFEYIEYGGVQDFFSFIKKFYLYILFIVILGILGREKIDHWILMDRYFSNISKRLSFLTLGF